MNTGTKHDGDKPRMDLLDTAALQGLADVLTFGAKKYAPHNWRNGINYSRLIAASLRHLTAVNKGEDIDPESGLLHVDHLACCVMFLSNYMHTGRTELDDRWKATAPMSREELLAKYPETWKPPTPQEYIQAMQGDKKTFVEDSHGHMVPMKPIPYTENELYARFKEQQTKAKEVIQAEHDKLFPSIKLK